VAIVLWLSAVITVEIDGRIFSGDFLGQGSVAAPTSRVAMFVLLVVLAIEVIPVALTGRSPGKAMSDLQLVGPPDERRPLDLLHTDPDEEATERSPRRARLGSTELEPLGFGAAAVRAGVVWLPLALGPVGLALAFANLILSLVTGRGLHDRLAGSAVVHSSLRPLGPGADTSPEPE